MISIVRGQVRNPEKVVDAAFEALNLEDWAGLADLCDPVSLWAFKREMLEDFCVPDDRDESKLEAELDDDDDEEDPEIRAAIEHDIAILREWSNPANRVRAEFASVETVDELREMDPGKMFARWLQAKKPDRYVERDRDASEDWKRQKTRASDKTTRSYQYTTLGSVLDGDKIAYVVYRNSKVPNDVYPGVMDEWESRIPEDEAELARDTRYLRHPLIVTCRKQKDGSWRLVASSHFSLVGKLQVVELRNE
jgi:hypothetical protein